MPVLSDMEHNSFPWPLHFTQKEVFMIEALRLRYADHKLLAVKSNSGGKVMPNKTFGEVLNYLRRNPRPVSEAA